jgi:DNA polymerase
MKKISLDFETYSECDIKKAGAWVYSKDKSTKILCMAYSIDDQTPNIWLPKDRHPDFLIHPEKYEIHAWNSFFEWVIWTHVLKLPTPPISQWYDTAALASAMALPRALGACAIALGMPDNQLKDKRGYFLINKLSKPNKLNGDKVLLEEMYNYCIQDVITEQAIAKKLYKLNPLERKIWELDQAINIRGVKVDRPRIKDAIYLYETQQQILKTNLISLTGLDNPNSQKQFLGWLLDKGVLVDNVQKSTLQNILNSPDEFGVHEAVKLKLSLSKSAPKKYLSIKEKIGKGTRLHGNIMYHGASTGRWVSTGVNLQNIARPTLDPNTCIELIKTRNINSFAEENINPIEALSSSIRGMLVPTKNKKFVVGDYASIEARVLAWLAEQKDKVEIFKSDGKIYEHTASKMFRKPVETITKDERFLGKIAELACGYGGGAKAFHLMAENYGVDISKEKANVLKNDWRRANPNIVKFWADIETCAKDAIRYGVARKLRNIEFITKNRFLWCKLPSGRTLAYYSPVCKAKKVLCYSIDGANGATTTEVYNEVIHGDKQKFLSEARRLGAEPYEFDSTVIGFLGTDSKTRKWCNQYTYGAKLVENIAQAVSRDIMAHSMLELEKENYDIVLTVHDEIISETESGTVEQFKTLMEKTPNWANGLPVSVEAYEAMRYKK